MMRRFSLATKLALTLSAFSLAVVLAILLAVKTSFDHGFERYINEAISERMDQLVINLAREPADFKMLLQNHRRWQRYLRNFLRDVNAQPELAPPSIETLQAEPPQAEPLHTESAPRRGLGRWGVVARSVWLLSPSGEYHGQDALPPVDTLHLLPVVADNEQLGYVAWRPIKPRDNALDAHFAERQHYLFGWIALSAVLMSCVLAWPLSRYLVNPVRRTSAAMGALMQREYSRRVPVTSNDELGELARDFNVMAQALEEQDHQQRQWLADISHELRTPLAVMKGELEAAEDGLVVLDAALTRSLGEEVNQLTRLVDDLHQLAITQVSHLRYQWQSLDLGQFMQQMATRLVPLLQQAELTWELQTPEEALWIRADSQRLEQLVMNLVQNSIRYTDRGGRVRVTLQRTEGIQLLWEDSAPGVAEQDLQHLFDRFYRVEHSRQRALGGSGLGLAIVANIAEAHSAKIAAKTSGLGGLCIALDFPAAEKGRSSP